MTCGTRGPTQNPAGLGDEARTMLSSAVHEVEERRGDQIERPAHPRIDVGQRNAEQREHQRRDGHRQPPEQLRALHPAVEDEEHRRRDRLGGDRQRAQLGRLDAAPELSEFDDPVVGGAGLAFVAAAVVEETDRSAVCGGAAIPSGRPS